MSDSNTFTISDSPSTSNSGGDVAGGTVTLTSTDPFSAGVDTGTITVDTCTGISYHYWPCTWWYPQGHTHSFFVAHKKENTKKVKLFLVCTSCGEGRKIEIPI